MKSITDLMVTVMDETENKTIIMLDAAAKRLSHEREAAIRQLMDEFSVEKKRTIENFLNEDQRMRGLLSEVQHTLAEGNKLIISVDSLVNGLNQGQSKTKTVAPAKPFDVNDYRATLSQVLKDRKNREYSQSVLQDPLAFKHDNLLNYKVF
jgi:hypothetical protein